MRGCACKEYIFQSYNASTFSAKRFDKNPFTCQRERKITRLKGFKFCTFIGHFQITSRQWRGEESRKYNHEQLQTKYFCCCITTNRTNPAYGNICTFSPIFLANFAALLLFPVNGSMAADSKNWRNSSTLGDQAAELDSAASAAGDVHTDVDSITFQWPFSHDVHFYNAWVH